MTGVTFARKRASATERGYGADWRRLRNALVAGKLGSPCPGCGVVLTQSNAQADHVLPLRLYPHLRLDPGNVRIVCRRCNARDGAQLGKRLAAAGYRLRAAEAVPARRSREW
jgi:5-methylcytosine-specific restriction endonuclease McrA